MPLPWAQQMYQSTRAYRYLQLLVVSSLISPLPLSEKKYIQAVDRRAWPADSQKCATPACPLSPHWSSSRRVADTGRANSYLYMYTK